MTETDQPRETPDRPAPKARTAENQTPQPLTRKIQQGLPTGQEPDRLQGQNGAIKPDGRG